MRWQRNMFQIKENDKTPEEELSEVEIGKLPEKELKVMILKIIKELGRRMDAQSEKVEVYNKALENKNNFETEKKNAVSEMKYILEGINSILNDTDEKISDLEERIVEITAAEQKKEKRMKRNEDSLRDHWDNKCTNICIIRVPKGEERKDLRKYLNR